VTCVAIDWSGAKKPAGKIWIVEATEGSLHRLQPLDSRDHVLRELLQYLQADGHTVVGLDFAFSFPCWFCREHSVCNAAQMWQLVDGQGERWLRECSWPFWGRPGKQRPALDAHFRRTEVRIGAANSIKPKSTFQIGGAGAVGTGSIRGMPFLPRLRNEGFAIWPFDDPRERMVVEIYPRSLTGPVVKSSEAARAEYVMDRHRWRLPEGFASKAIGSEDAFDAAVSALVMDTHCEQFQSLRSGDPLSRIEGEIWAP
jgi:hypothetical protein